MLCLWSFRCQFALRNKGDRACYATFKREVYVQSEVTTAPSLERLNTFDRYVSLWTQSSWFAPSLLLGVQSPQMHLDRTPYPWPILLVQILQLPVLIFHHWRWKLEWHHQNRLFFIFELATIPVGSGSGIAWFGISDCHHRTSLYIEGQSYWYQSC